MPIRDPKEVFLLMLSDVRRGVERSTKAFQELSGIAQDPEIKEALEACISNDIAKSWMSASDLSARSQ
jgi:hypothetical protein